MEPKNYVGDNFARVTDIYRVTQYNMACCYSSLNQARPCEAVLAIYLIHRLICDWIARWMLALMH